MSLIIEDGTGKPDAQSFVTEAELVSFAAARGITITTNQAAIHLVKAMDLLLVRSSGYGGVVKVVTQALPFPRLNMTINGIVVPDTGVPIQAKMAQKFAALASFDGLDLLPTQQNGAQLIERSNPAVTKKWAYDPDRSTVPELPLVDNWLSIFDTTYTGGVLYNVRA